MHLFASGYEANKLEQHGCFFFHCSLAIQRPIGKHFHILFGFNAYAWDTLNKNTGLRQ